MASEQHDRQDEERIDQTPRRARQGERGPSMLLVLGIGLLGLVIAYGLVGWMNSDDETVSLSVIEDGVRGGDVPAPADQPAGNEEDAPAQ